MPVPCSEARAEGNRRRPRSASAPLVTSPWRISTENGDPNGDVEMDEPSLEDPVGEGLAVDPGELTDDSGPLTRGGWSGLKHRELVCTLEEGFGGSLSRADIVAMRSMADIRAMLVGKGAVR